MREWGEPPVSVVCAVVCALVCVFVRIHISCGYLLICYFCAWEPGREGTPSFLSGSQVPHPHLEQQIPRGLLGRG